MADRQEHPEEPEPHPWRPLARIGRESILLLFYLGQHGVLRVVARWLGLEHEWWARALLALSAAYAVVGFTVIIGAELVTDCWEAIAHMLRRIRRR